MSFTSARCASGKRKVSAVSNMYSRKSKKCTSEHVVRNARESVIESGVYWSTRRGLPCEYVNLPCIVTQNSAVLPVPAIVSRHSIRARLRNSGVKGSGNEPDATFRREKAVKSREVSTLEVQCNGLEGEPMNPVEPFPV